MFLGLIKACPEWRWEFAWKSMKKWDLKGKCMYCTDTLSPESWTMLSQGKFFCSEPNETQSRCNEQKWPWECLGYTHTSRLFPGEFHEVNKIEEKLPFWAHIWAENSWITGWLYRFHFSKLVLACIVVRTCINCTQRMKQYVLQSFKENKEEHQETIEGWREGREKDGKGIKMC